MVLAAARFQIEARPAGLFWLAQAQDAVFIEWPSDDRGGGVPQSAVGLRFFLGMGQTSGKLGAASFSVTARLYLDPYYGTPGSTASVIGYGFGPFETVDIFWDNGSTALGTVTADRYGTFKGSSAFTLTIPSNAAPGTNTVTATETYPAASASAIYTVD